MGRGAEVRGVKMLNTYRQTYRQTYRASDEAGPRGAFAPNKYLIVPSLRILNIC